MIISFSRRKCTTLKEHDGTQYSGTRYRRALGKRKTCHLVEKRELFFCVLFSFFLSDLANTGRGLDTEECAMLFEPVSNMLFFYSRGVPLARMGEWGNPRGYAPAVRMDASAEQVTTTVGLV